MTWVLIIGVAWVAVSVVAALLIAGTVRLAEQRHRRVAASAQGNFVVDLHRAGNAADAAVAAEGSPQAPISLAEDRPRPAAEERSDGRRNIPAARKPVVRNCIPPSERTTQARETGTR